MRDSRTFAEEKRVHKGGIRQDTFCKALLVDPAAGPLDIVFSEMSVPRLVLKALLQPLAGNEVPELVPALGPDSVKRPGPARQNERCDEFVRYYVGREPHPQSRGTRLWARLCDRHSSESSLCLGGGVCWDARRLDGAARRRRAQRQRHSGACDRVGGGKPGEAATI